MSISETETFILVRSSTYMNNSGNNLKLIEKRFGKPSIENTLICCDFLDLEIGKFKIKEGVSPR